MVTRDKVPNIPDFSNMSDISLTSTGRITHTVKYLRYIHILEYLPKPDLSIAAYKISFILHVINFTNLRTPLFFT